tara:strand:+ start:572 stop:739 length:168 start_codon:yes stop_codon:yes gene_type:complete
MTETEFNYYQEREQVQIDMADFECSQAIDFLYNKLGSSECKKRITKIINDIENGR